MYNTPKGVVFRERLAASDSQILYQLSYILRQLSWPVSVNCTRLVYKASLKIHRDISSH